MFLSISKESLDIIEDALLEQIENLLEHEANTVPQKKVLEEIGRPYNCEGK